MPGVPFTFATQTSPIPLADLDANFNTQLTIGTTSVGLGNTTGTLANVTLNNATINGSSLTLSSIALGNGTTVTPAVINANGPYALLLENVGAGLYFGVTGGAASWQFSDGGGTPQATISAATGVYTAVSDAARKTVREKQTDYRAAIQALWVGDFDWKETAKEGVFKDPVGHGFGVLAQQAYDTMPDHLGVLHQSDFWGAEPGTFGYLALWGVKDLYKIIGDLTARIAALEAKQ